MENIALSEHEYADKVIRTCPLFNRLPENKLEKLTHFSQVITVEEHTAVFSQGQAARHFYLLLEGEVKLAASSTQGQEKVIHIVHPGQTFAEALMFLEGPIYPVSAVALLPSQAIKVPNDAYKSILSESEQAYLGVLGEYAIRIRHLISEIENLTLHNATFRVVHYLLTKLPSHQATTAASIELPIPKHVLASRLSITPETLSRIFTQLKHDGIIETKENVIVLLDMDWMRRFITES